MKIFLATVCLFFIFGCSSHALNGAKATGHNQERKAASAEPSTLSCLVNDRPISIVSGFVCGDDQQEIKNFRKQPYGRNCFLIGTATLSQGIQMTATTSTETPCLGIDLVVNGETYRRLAPRIEGSVTSRGFRDSLDMCGFPEFTRTELRDDSFRIDRDHNRLISAVSIRVDGKLYTVFCEAK